MADAAEEPVQDDAAAAAGDAVAAVEAVGAEVEADAAAVEADAAPADAAKPPSPSANNSAEEEDGSDVTPTTAAAVAAATTAAADDVAAVTVDTTASEGALEQVDAEHVDDDYDGTPTATDAAAAAAVTDLDGVVLVDATAMQSSRSVMNQIDLAGAGSMDDSRKTLDAVSEHPVAGEGAGAEVGGTGAGAGAGASGGSGGHDALEDVPLDEEGADEYTVEFHEQKLPCSSPQQQHCTTRPPSCPSNTISFLPCSGIWASHVGSLPWHGCAACAAHGGCTAGKVQWSHVQTPTAHTSDTAAAMLCFVQADGEMPTESGGAASQLRVGARVVAVNGQHVENESFDHITATIQAAGRPVKITFSNAPGRQVEQRTRKRCCCLF